MSESLLKLSPHRDLQVYFERPSAIAAISGASTTGYVLSGTWRQQFDWAVVEWNRDNVYEPHFMRNLPDGDLSGLTLSYEECRFNCIAVDSDLFPTIDWHVLRIWTNDASGHDLYKVSLKPLSEAIEGSYVCPSLSMTLQGSATAGDCVGISLLDEHYTYEVLGGDSIASIVSAIGEIVNALSTYAAASSVGDTITLTYHGSGQTVASSTIGSNGNRVGAYGFVAGAKTERWSPSSGHFSGGTSPTKWRFTIPFGSLIAMDGRTVPSQHVRKMRWTYAAELHGADFARSEFSVEVSNWSVTGNGREYSIPGISSKRFEESQKEWSYSGSWNSSIGNFSGGTIRYSTNSGCSATLDYEINHPHGVALGTRFAFNASSVQIWLDGIVVLTENLLIPGEDQLARLLIEDVAAGAHTVEVRHIGPDGNYLYLDYLEAFVRESDVPIFPSDPKINLATDWDTDHSLAIPAERTAWLISILGFHGRVNHYVGALWFYELVRDGHKYASVRIEFLGVPAFSAITNITIGRDGYAPSTDLVANHLNRIGDTADSIATAFELEFNRGYTAIRAVATGNVLTIYARAMGGDGNDLNVSASPIEGDFQVIVSQDHFSGGIDGVWKTDLEASPRLNRACRDWSTAFFRCMKDCGLEVTCAFSMELQHGDTSSAAAIAQRYPDGTAVYLNTPALQTNFSPVSYSYWKDVYLGMADLMASSGITPYLQFGEVQWWYFELNGVGMPFYDEYTRGRFESEYSRPIQTISSHVADPAPYVEELSFLSNLIGEFTSAIIAHVRGTHTSARFEVLYPTDVNNTALNSLVNYPASHWTPSMLDCLKTESFTYTFLRNVDLGRFTVEYGKLRNFPASKRAFLCGIGDSTSSWMREVAIAKGENMDSITLFALDQYCLIGYGTPLRLSESRSFRS